MVPSVRVERAAVLARDELSGAREVAGLAQVKWQGAAGRGDELKSVPQADRQSGRGRQAISWAPMAAEVVVKNELEAEGLVHAPGLR
jgi:hypothetical protein